MKRWHKFVLVLSVLSVLFTSLSVSVFADSIAVNPDVNLKPWFAPSSVRFYGGLDVADLSLFSDVTVSTENGDDTVLGVATLYETLSDEWLRREYSLDPPSFNSDGSVNFNFGETIHFNTSFINPDRLEFIFNDFYFSDYNIHFTDIFDLSLEFFANDYFLSVYSLSLSCDIVYLESDHLSTDSFAYSVSSPAVVEFLPAFVVLENYLYNNHLDGGLVTNMSVLIEAEDYFTHVNFDGTIRYVEYDVPSGAYAALDAWSDHYGDTIINDAPTILESVQIGLDAVWNTSLFGLFTIGQVFSACAGLALFTWLLKIFNR